MTWWYQAKGGTVMTERRRISDENKALAMQLSDEVFNAHNLARCDDLYDPNYIANSLPPGFSPDREGMKQYLSAYFQAFPDFHVTIENMIAEGDWVAIRYTGHGTHQGDLMGMGIPPTGKEVTASAVMTLRIVDSRIIEDWLDGDKLGILQQIGAIPSSAQA
jgi:predicted ester cyclase